MDILVILADIILLGYGILLGAIVINGLAKKMQLLSWYDYLSKSKKANFSSRVWLFILYPISLGVIAYLITLVL